MNKNIILAFFKHFLIIIFLKEEITLKSEYLFGIEPI